MRSTRARPPHAHSVPAPSVVLKATMGAQTFVGRDGDCEVLSGLLADERLVTIVGPGGVGKTRIAAELTERLAQRFPGGVSVVEMSGATEQDDIASIASRQLDVESVEALLLRSVDAETLLILDSCESALEEVRSGGGGRPTRLPGLGGPGGPTRPRGGGLRKG